MLVFNEYLVRFNQRYKNTDVELVSHILKITVRTRHSASEKQGLHTNRNVDHESKNL